MPNQYWVNLPVKDLGKSVAFFKKLGFEVQAQPHQAVLLPHNPSTPIMLFPEETFQSFSMNELPNLKTSTEVLFSIGAESRKEVEELARKAMEAGGSLFAEPMEVDGWMYGCGIQDLDGHRWNVLFLDYSKKG